MKLSEKFTRPPKFLTIEKYLRKQDQPIASHPDARFPRIVPLVIIDYGSLMARVKQMRYISGNLVGSLIEMSRSAKSIKDNPYYGKTEIDAKTLKEMEVYARSLGITDIGYTQVNTRFIFNGFRILYKNAIVFTIEMNKAKICLAPSIPSFVEVFRTYYQVGVIVNRVSEFLRKRGFNAHAGPAVGGDANYIPLAIDAGLGETGKNGLLITKANGPRVRLAAVYTDIDNLPYSKNTAPNWVKKYCETCDRCVDKCPSDAIFRETRMHADGGPVFIDHIKCAKPFSNDNGCTLCIKYCPFSYVAYDKLKARFEKSRAFAKRRL